MAFQVFTANQSEELYRGMSAADKKYYGKSDYERELGEALERAGVNEDTFKQ